MPQNKHIPTPKIMELDGMRLIGMKFTVSVAAAMYECPKAWEKFAPRMDEIKSLSGFSFGACRMISDEELDYLVSMDAGPAAGVPANMEEWILPGGLFAVFPVESLAVIGKTWEDIYSLWLPQNGRYDARFDAVSLERYPADFMQTGKSEILIPISKK